MYKYIYLHISIYRSFSTISHHKKYKKLHFLNLEKMGLLPRVKTISSYYLNDKLLTI